MIDFGLLMSGILGFGVPSLLVNWWPLSSYDDPVGFLDAAIGPAFAALFVGRLTALAFDDPSSIGSVSDMLIIRSGVEFWPGVITGGAVLVWSAYRAGLPLLTRVSDLTPLAMVGYAAYEAACVFRDGCFGPESPIGLRPPGLATTMLPIGWFMAVALVIGAVGVRALAERGSAAAVVVSSAVVIVAAVRAVGSIWLPHVGDGLTRQHLTSIGVAIVFSLSLITAAVTLGRSRSASPPSA